MNAGEQATQELVAHFVRTCASVGVEPIAEQRARVGRMVKKLVAANKQPDVLRCAVDRMVERNRAPETLAYIVVELERERAGAKPSTQSGGAAGRPMIADLAERYAREAAS